MNLKIPLKSKILFLWNYALFMEKEMASHSSVLAWRIPGTGEPGGLPSLGSHSVGHDWSNLAAACSIQCSLQYYKPPTIHFLKKERKKVYYSSVWNFEVNNETFYTYFGM